MIVIKEERNKFYDTYQDLFAKLIDDSGIYGEPLYHYTSPQSLISILKKEAQNDAISLHFTRADTLNDLAEGREFYKYYEETSDKLLNEGKISQEFYHLISKIDRKDIFWWDEPIPLYPYKASETYICSFSKGKDLLPMWNYYSKNSQYEGYNLGIKLESDEQLKKAFLSDGITGEIYLHEVIYDAFKVKSALYEFLIKLYQKCDLKSEWDKFCVEIDIQLASSLLRYIVKNSAFEHEQECRFILKILKGSSLDKIDFRTKNGLLIPYIDAKLSRSFLKEITIGPLIEQKTARNTLEFFLNKNGYKVRYDRDSDDGILINNSDVPIRY